MQGEMDVLFMTTAKSHFCLTKACLKIEIQTFQDFQSRISGLKCLQLDSLQMSFNDESMSQLRAAVVNFKNITWLFSRFPARQTRFIVIRPHYVVPR